MEKANITAVSYLNTLPFVYGMKSKLNRDTTNLMLDVPSECARKILLNTVDFGLAPSGILPSIDQQYLPLDYCIAADGKVDTVMLYSRMPLESITSIHLDADSRTSVLLVRILAAHHWNIHPEWIPQLGGNTLSDAESVLAIGDKAFEMRNKYPYAFDLAEEWKKMTGLPFVFARWMVRKDTHQSLISTIQEALEYGVSHIDDAISSIQSNEYQHVNIPYYLKNCIQLKMTNDFQRGLDLYLSLIKNLVV